jgi:hypothetical protein
MVNPRNRTQCTAADIAKRIYDVLADTTPAPPGFETLKIFCAPAIPLVPKHDYPFIAVDVYSGDTVDQRVMSQSGDSTGRLMACNSLMTLNIRATLEAKHDNNGLKALAPLHRWAMRHVMRDRELRAMSFGPINPVGWDAYDDIHESAVKGLIQKIEFRHILNIETADEEPVGPN